MGKKKEKKKKRKAGAIQTGGSMLAQVTNTADALETLKVQTPGAILSKPPQVVEAYFDRSTPPTFAREPEDEDEESGRGYYVNCPYCNAGHDIKTRREVKRTEDEWRRSFVSGQRYGVSKVIQLTRILLAHPELLPPQTGPARLADIEEAIKWLEKLIG